MDGGGGGSGGELLAATGGLEGTEDSSVPQNIQHWLHLSKKQEGPGQEELMGW